MSDSVVDRVFGVEVEPSAPVYVSLVPDSPPPLTAAELELVRHRAGYIAAVVRQRGWDPAVVVTREDLARLVMHDVPALIAAVDQKREDGELRAMLAGARQEIVDLRRIGHQLADALRPLNLPIHHQRAVDEALRAFDAVVRP